MKGVVSGHKKRQGKSKTKSEPSDRIAIDSALKRVTTQAISLLRISQYLHKEDTKLIQKIVEALRKSDARNAIQLIKELVALRRFNRTLTDVISTISRESWRLRELRHPLTTGLNTITELGDIVVNLTPSMASYRNVKQGLATSSLEPEKDTREISKLLEAILLDKQAPGYSLDFDAANKDADRILAEAAALAERRMKESQPSAAQKREPEQPLQEVASRIPEYPFNVEGIKANQAQVQILSEVGSFLEKEKALLKPILLGASAPEGVTKGAKFTARFVAYEKEVERKVENILSQSSPSSRNVLAVRRCRWKIGTRVMVKLSADRVRIEKPEQEFTWEGGYSILDFDVQTPRSGSTGNIVLKFEVFIEGFLVGAVSLDFALLDHEQETRLKTAGAHAATTAFASYASEDLERVLDRVAALQISANMDIFLSHLSLHPNEQWREKLLTEIRSRDLFLLFWSIYAKKSKWVRWEWKTALVEKGVNGMQVHPLQPVSEAKPPRELRHLHFGDPYMLARRALEREEGPN